MKINLFFITVFNINQSNYLFQDSQEIKTQETLS